MTWVSVNLPLFPLQRLDLSSASPESIYQNFVLSGGKTFRQACAAHFANTKAIWDREGKNTRDHIFIDLSQKAQDEIHESSAYLHKLQAELSELPAIKELQALTKTLKEDYEKSYFSDKLKVGMLLEFKDGRRILVGDINVEGAQEGGDCPENGIVARYTMIEIPK